MTTKRRRARGDGTVYYDEARGRWIGAITVDGQRRKVTGRDKTEATANLRVLVAAKTTRAAVPDKRTTVEYALDDFMKRGLPNRTSNRRPLAPSTIERHGYAAAHIRREVGKVRLVDLDVRAVEMMLDRLTTRGLGRASQHKVLSTFKLALDFAEDRGQVIGNVARKATISPEAAPSVRRKALQPDDARKLLAALRDERNGAMFAMSLMLGLRPGEASALHWSDVVDNVVNVTRGVQVVNNRAAVVDDLKTESSRRTIEMPPMLEDWLAEHRRVQVAERLAAASWGDDQLVFATKMGTVLSPSNNRRQLSAICARVDIPEVKPNELRHSCASLLSDDGVSNEQIADLLGHTTTRMVDQTYRHRLRPVVDVAARPQWAEHEG